MQANDACFEQFRTWCMNFDGLKEVNVKHCVRVFVKSSGISDMNIIKMDTILENVSAITAFEAASDVVYRQQWHPYVSSSFKAYSTSDNSDICYKRLKMRKTFKSRHYVLKRAWKMQDREALIVNYSVEDEGFPPISKYVRGFIHLSGYRIITMADSTTDAGCYVTYVVLQDLRGSIPAWMGNVFTKKINIKMMIKLRNACQMFDTWREGYSEFEVPGLLTWVRREDHVEGLQSATEDVDSDSDEQHVEQNQQPSLLSYVRSTITNLWREDVVDRNISY